MQKITPFLWFDNQAEEAMNFYVSVFENSRVGKISRYGKAGQDVHGKNEGSVMAVEFEGGAPADAATVVDLMALAAPETNSLVIGLCRPRGSLFLDRFEIEAVQEMADRCEKTGTGLLYVIVANEEGWRCVPEFGDPELD